MATQPLFDCCARNGLKILSMGIFIDYLSKSFDGHSILSGIRLNVAKGELLALIGPSGSGKTTLLRIIAGLDSADEGQLMLGDEDATALCVQERRVGFVFQHYALFKHMTVRENIAFGLTVRPRRLRWPRERIDQHVDELLRLVQLEGLDTRYPVQLSGGQRQRVALARALAIQPRVLLLDEPFGALDALVRRDLRGCLRRLHEQTNVTTVFVTHDQEDAFDLADRVAILNAGKIEQVDHPAAIYDRPATPFVYAFLGEVNQRIGVTTSSGFQTGAFHLHSSQPDYPAQTPVTLFIRPEDVCLDPDGWQGQIVVSKRTGPWRRLRVRLADGTFLAVEGRNDDLGENAVGTWLRLGVRRYGVFRR